jgi:hypothetical protein
MVVDVPSLVPGGEPVRSEAARQRADQVAEAGDYRSALRYLVLATLLYLQERGALDLRPGLTNHDYLSLLRNRASEVGQSWTLDQSALQELVQAFDRTWYGHQPFDEADLARCQELVGRVLKRPQIKRAA